MYLHAYAPFQLLILMRVLIKRVLRHLEYSLTEALVLYVKEISITFTCRRQT